MATAALATPETASATGGGPAADDRRPPAAGCPTPLLARSTPARDVLTADPRAFARAAARNGLAAEALARVVERDRTARLDRCGMLHYVEPSLSPAQDAAAYDEGLGSLGHFRIALQTQPVTDPVPRTLPVLTTTARSFPGRMGTASRQELVAAGGDDTRAWTAGGSLPPGLALGPDGVLRGTPTRAGSYAFDAVVASAGQRARATVQVLVASDLRIGTGGRPGHRAARPAGGPLHRPPLRAGPGPADHARPVAVRPDRPRRLRHSGPPHLPGARALTVAPEAPTGAGWPHEQQRGGRGRHPRQP